MSLTQTVWSDDLTKADPPEGQQSERRLYVRAPYVDVRVACHLKRGIAGGGAGGEIHPPLKLPLDERKIGCHRGYSRRAKYRSREI